VWINPPPIPLTTAEMDHVFDLPYARRPHPAYADEHGSHDGATKIPAWEMIRFSVNIMRGCFGGCTFCSITEHEGRIIQSRSEDSIIHEIEEIRDKVKGFTGVISDLGGPTANMYRLGCKSPEIEAACRKPSCVYPGICQNLNTDHAPLIKIYRRARALKGIKKILIGSGLRYDLAVKSPEYVKELVQHHVGGYLKIAPEHTEGGPLSKMMKPGIGTYDASSHVREVQRRGRQEAVPDPLLHRRPPGHQRRGHDEPGALAEAQRLPRRPGADLLPQPHGHRHGHVPLRPEPAQGHQPRRAQGREGGHRARRETPPPAQGLPALPRPNNWPLLREALKAMGRADLIGNGKHHLIPTWQPSTDGSYQSARRSNSTPAPAKGGAKPGANRR
jgi:hypothetical protein